MKNIIIPLSLWETTETVVEQGVRQGEAFRSTVWLLHVVKVPPQLPRWPKELREQRAREIKTLQHELEERAAAIARRGVAAKAVVVEGSDVVEAILEQAAEVEADLIVMGSHARGGFYGTILGDVARDVLHRTACPVLIVPMRVARSRPDQ